MTDYRTLLAEQIEADWEIEAETVHPYDDAPYTVVAVLATPDELAGSFLATRIPDLCPDCKGQKCGRCGQWKVIHNFDGPGDYDCGPCTHPNAPTIADLLRCGGAAWSAYYGPTGRSHAEVYYAVQDAALRGEGQ